MENFYAGALGIGDGGADGGGQVRGVAVVDDDTGLPAAFGQVRVVKSSFEERIDEGIREFVDGQDQLEFLFHRINYRHVRAIHHFSDTG